MKRILLIIFTAISSILYSQSDCISAIPVCGSSNLSFTPSGHGLIAEELGGCMATDERFTVWYTFTVGTAGTLAFTIVPNDPSNDYDFAVYGPNVSCSTIGTTSLPIRCNYSGTPGNTGLSLTVPGPLNNNQWSPFLNVTAGQTYYLVVDNYSMSTSGFTLQWSGTATLNSPFNDPAIQPNPFIAPGTNHDGNVVICENPATFNFSSLSTGIINGNPNFTINYFQNANDALTGANPISSPILVNTTSTYHYALSYIDPANPNNPINTCKKFGEIHFIQGAITVNNATLTVCNNNNQGTGVFDLTSVSNAMFADPTATKKYYPTLADLNAGTNEITFPSAYISGAPGQVYMKVTSTQNCSAYGTISLQFHPVVVTQPATLSSCFIEANPSTGTFNLTNAVVSTQPGVTKKFYPSLQDAINSTNEIINASAYISSSTTVYARVTNSNGCWGTAKITLSVIPPNYSLTLKDKIICIENKTTLNAGSGFQSYLWSTGANTQTITDVTVGEYWVDLTTEGCVTRQKVKVIKSPAPVITNIEINNNSATIIVNGGTQPYKYSLDGSVWQDSNVFNNLPRGQNFVYIKDQYNCLPIITEITVPNLVNVITPNGDNINDIIDYSALAYKKDVIFNIYDRYGAKIFQVDKNNGYKWDGRVGGRKVSSGTYWYSITWTEPVTKIPIKYSGWVMVKNRE